MVKTTSTTMILDKTCKSCRRYKTDSTDEKVSTSLYLINESFEALGKPEKITVSISKT